MGLLSALVANCGLKDDREDAASGSSSLLSEEGVGATLTSNYEEALDLSARF